jgi:ClpP class serine protease
MADPNDVLVTKLARREFNKHLVNMSMADIRVNHGVVYVRGTIMAQKGAHYANVEEETARIARILRQRPEVRDVVLDCTFRNLLF